MSLRLLVCPFLYKSPSLPILNLSTLPPLLHQSSSFSLQTSPALVQAFNTLKLALELILLCFISSHPWYVSFLVSFLFLRVVCGMHVFFVVVCSLGWVIHFSFCLKHFLHVCYELYLVQACMDIYLFCSDHVCLDFYIECICCQKNVIFIAYYS